MSGKPKPEPLLSLRQCERQLSDRLGEGAPAYTTLKRWAAAGVLKPAQGLKPGGTRPLYRLAPMLTIATRRQEVAAQKRSNGRDEQPQPTASAPSPVLALVERPALQSPVERLRLVPAQSQGDAATDLGAPGIRELLSEMSQTLIEIRDSLVGRAELQREVASQVESLDAARRSMMNKYDSEANLLRQRAAALAEQNGALKKEASSIEVAKLNRLMSNVSDTLATLAGGQR